jgi:hypothetical protein
MTEAPGQRNIPRSILSIVAAFIAVIILSLGTDVLLHYIAGFPPLGQKFSDPQFAWATVYRTIYGVVGSYITAALAPRRPVKHALIGGAIGFALSLFGAIEAWNKVETMGPHWYALALVIGAFPTAWLGAKIRLMQIGAR